MSRLTKNISDKQTYCGYEVKKCKYQQIYDFKRYDELEDYVDCDLTLAIDKLGKLEDLEEQLGCPLEVIFKLVNQNELYYQFYNELQHWTSIKIDLRKKVVWYCKQVGGHYACSQPLSNYGKTFWLKEDRSE